MPTFGVDDWNRMSTEFAEPLRKDAVAALRLMVHPTAPIAAMSAFGFGLAAHAVGIWAGAVIGAAQASQRLFAPLDDPRDAVRPTGEVIPLQSRARPALKVVPKAEEPAPASAGRPASEREMDALRRPAPKARAEEPARAKPAAPAKPAASEAAPPAERAAAASTPKADAPKKGPRKPRAVERPLVPDDLKAISGIGPKVEKVLNDLGVWTYAQVAGWKKEEIAWLDDYLSFKGRIDRDGWVAQAAALSMKARG